MASIVCNGVRFDAIRAVIFDKDGTLADSRQYLWHLGEKRADAIVQALKTASFEKFWLRPGRNVPPKFPKTGDFKPVLVQSPPFMGDLGGDPTSQTQQINSIDLALKTAILETFGCNQTSIDPAGRLAVGTREENEIAIASLIAETGYNLNQARSLVHAAFLAADQQLPRKAPLTPLFVGVIELVKSLSPLKLGILSSDTEANIQDFVETYQLSPYFSAIVGAQTGISKPNPKLLALACEALNIEPETALVIGDTSADTKLTPRSIGVTWGGSTIEQLDNVAAVADQPADIQLCRI
ncbi:HAD family hydrolase [Leptolyngbya sp. DQ-M1]|uniref:HAD family hydrolase n=1 Tax=Leptolyngbya sp. DQ-M1 TaxID=2933920 RepID=UPI003297C1FE